MKIKDCIININGKKRQKKKEVLKGNGQNNYTNIQQSDKHHNMYNITTNKNQ